jgi:hypothetical protein
MHFQCDFIPELALGHILTKNALRRAPGKLLSTATNDAHAKRENYHQFP